MIRLIIKVATLLFAVSLIIGMTSCESEYSKVNNELIQRYSDALAEKDLQKSKKLSNILEDRKLNSRQMAIVQGLNQNLSNWEKEKEEEERIAAQKRAEKAKKAEEERKMRNLELNPPTSVSDLKKRIEGTVWISEHGINDVLYPKYEFRSGKVSHYVMSAEGGWFFCDSYSYTVKDEGDFYSITFGDGRDLKHLTTSIVFVKSNGAVACFVHETGQRGLLHLENY